MIIIGEDIQQSIREAIKNLGFIYKSAGNRINIKSENFTIILTVEIKVILGSA